MIWGASKTEWTKTFLFLPRQLIDGRWAWLTEVEQTNYYNKDVSFSAPHTTLFSTCFREIVDKGTGSIK